MKVITTLPKIHKYLKNKDTDQNEQICIVLDGMSFNQNNKFSSLIQRVVQIPNKIKTLQLSLVGVESKEDDLEQNLRLLNKLNFEEQEFILNIQDFIWNGSKENLQYFLRFANEVVQKQSPKNLTILFDKKSKICISGSSLYIKFINAYKLKNFNEVHLSLTKLIKSLQSKKINRLQFIYKFSLSKIKQQCQIDNLYFLLSALGGLSQLQQVDIRYRTEQEYSTKELIDISKIFNLKNHLLQNVNLITYNEKLYDILQTSFHLSDNQSNFNIFKKEQSKQFLIIGKKDKELILNLDKTNKDRIPQDKLKSVSKTIDSWCMYKLNDLKIKLSGYILQTYQDIVNSLCIFIKKQLSTKQLTLSFSSISQIGNFQQQFKQLQESLLPLKQLTQLNILILNEKQIYNQEQTYLNIAKDFSLLNQLKTIVITLQQQSKYMINQFAYLFQIVPNIESIEIYNEVRDNKVQEISLKSSTLKIIIECKQNSHFEDVFESLKEENFKIRKQQLSLIIMASCFENVTNEIFIGNLQNISSKFIDIDLNFDQLKMIPFQVDFSQEIKRDRRYSLKIQNDVILYKEFKKMIHFAFKDVFNRYLQNLYPENNVQQITPVKRLAIYIKKRIDKINSIKNNKEEINLNESHIKIKHEQLQLSNEQEVNIEELQQTIQESISSQIQKEQKIKKKYNTIKDPLKKYTQVLVPQRYEKLMELIILSQEYDRCKLDFSKLQCPELIKLLISSQIRFSRVLDLNISSNMQTDKDFIGFRQFFQKFCQKTQQLTLNFQNHMCFTNQSAINTFYTLQKLNKNLTHIDLNLSQTSVKKRGLISLCLKIKKLQKLVSIKIDISNSMNRNALKLIVLNNIFEQASHQIHPDLEEFSVKASNVKLDLNQDFYDLLGKSITLMSKNLKKLQLKFSNNIYSQCSTKQFLASLQTLPEDLQKISLNFQQVQNYSQDHLFSFCKIPNFIQQLQLQELVIKTCKYADIGIDMEQYAVLLIRFFKQINYYKFNKLVIDIYDFNLVLKDKQLSFNTQYGILNFLDTISTELQQKLVFSLSEFILKSSPNVIINKDSLNSLFNRFQIIG